MDILLLVTLIIENKEAIIATTTAVVTGASALAALTPTKKDDNLFNKLLNLMALNIGGAKPDESDGLVLGLLKAIRRNKS